jgi:outer membrane protein OmpA-like peptidoglycan-associated protein
MRRVIAAVFATFALLSTGSAAHALQLSVDGDADGVDDSIDLCLYSSPGSRVDAQGCAQEADEDGDGIADTIDACPFSPTAAAVDAHGCAIDDDFDGVANGVDQCSATALGAVVDARGCGTSQAARTAAVAPKPAAIRAAAAPAAAVSPAPAVPPRPPAAPAIAPAPAAPADARPSLLSLSFSPGGAHLGEAGARRLRDAVPRLKQSLAEDRLAVLVVEGYADTDSDGPQPDTLARTRANRVRRLLADEGIDPVRLRSLGHAATASAPGGKPQRRADVVLERE